MAARILRLIFVVPLLLSLSHAAGEVPEQPYRAYLPLIRTDACELVFANFFDNALFRPGQPFDARWTLKNTGNAAWLPGSAIIRFASGDRMHSGNDERDLPDEVIPGGMVDFIISMDAPNSSGAYISNWEINQEGLSLCSFHIMIRVP